MPRGRSLPLLLTQMLGVGYHGTMVQIALDVFPAKVTLPSGAMLDTARVYVADGDVLVYTAGLDEPALMLRRPLVGHEGNLKSGMSLQVEDGVVSVTRSKGCGCGHPLRWFNPWRGEQRQVVAM